MWYDYVNNKIPIMYSVDDDSGLTVILTKSLRKVWHAMNDIESILNYLT